MPPIPRASRWKAGPAPASGLTSDPARLAACLHGRLPGEQARAAAVPAAGGPGSKRMAAPDAPGALIPAEGQTTRQDAGPGWACHARAHRFAQPMQQAGTQASGFAGDDAPG